MYTIRNSLGDVVESLGNSLRRMSISSKLNQIMPLTKVTPSYPRIKIKATCMPEHEEFNQFHANKLMKSRNSSQ